VLKQYWNAANDSLRLIAEKLMPPSGEFRADLYADVFMNVLDSDEIHAEAAVTAFIDVHERALALSGGDMKARHGARIQALREAQGEVVSYVREAVAEFAELTRLWPRLVAAARAVHPA
jgi:hypothetical protein